MRATQFLMLLHVALLLGLVGYSVWGHSELPEQYSVQFDAQGEQVRSAEGGGLSYWLPPILAVAFGLGVLPFGSSFAGSSKRVGLMLVLRVPVQQEDITTSQPFSKIRMHSRDQQTPCADPRTGW